jgi:acyl-CoA thioester hydrolase
MSRMERTTHQIRVRYGETDKQGVVFYAEFFNYLEVARTEHMRTLGLPYRELEARGVFLVVAQAHCRYLAPARYDDVLTVTTWVSQMRRSTLDFSARVALAADGMPVAEGMCRMAVVDAEGRLRRVPGDVRALIDVVDDRLEVP